jgi:hypothetical protein
MDFDRFLQLIDAMNREGVEFFVLPTPENIERLRRALRTVWNDPHIEEITAEDLAGDYPAIAYGPPGEEFTIDFLARLGEAFAYDDLRWETGQIEGRQLRVVTARQLFDMKRGTVRYKDKIDADALRRKFLFPET